MRDIILLGALSLAGLIAFRRPSFGLLTYVFLGVFNPQSFTWGFARTFAFSQMIVISTIAGVALSSERKTFPAQRELALLIVLWGFMGVTTLFALYPAEALEKYGQVSKIFLMVVISAILINTKEKLHSLIRVIGLSLGFYGLKGGVFAIATGGGHIVFGPELSFLYANNSIGLALAMNIPILLYLLRQEQRSWLRWVIKFMLLFSYPAIICTYSRGAWVGMVLATAVSVLKSRKKFITLGTAALVTLFLVIIVPGFAPPSLSNRYNDLINYNQEVSAQSRFWNWEFCRRVGVARPLTGGGFDFYTLEAYDKFYPEFQEHWQGKVWSCHSMWLTVFGEQGPVGFAIWLSLMLCCMGSLRQIRGRASNRLEEKYVVDFVEMIRSSLLTYFVVGTFLDAAYFDLFYYFVAFVVIQKQIAVQAANGEPSPSFHKTALYERGKVKLEPA